MNLRILALCFGLFFFLLNPSSTYARIVVFGEHDDGQHKVLENTTKDIRKVSHRTIESKKPQSLSRALEFESGVDIQTVCGSCGAQRVSLNGMKGEHTSILMDNNPVLSSVSSFYGIDSIPLVAIDSLEISRGSGASIFAPDSIGGVINAVTRSPEVTMTQMELNQGNAGESQASLYTAGQIANSKLYGNLALQINQQGSWDVNNNQISEAPARKSFGGYSHLKYRLDDKNELSFKYLGSELTILGGSNTLRQKPPLWTDPNKRTFANNNNVNSTFTTHLDSVSEWINVKKQNYWFSWNHNLSEIMDLHWDSTLSVQKQESIYNFHRFDYDNTDRFHYHRLHLTYMPKDHIIDIGLTHKNQRYQSQSQKLYIDRSPPLQPDNFDHVSSTFFIQDFWTPIEKLEIEWSMVIDKLSVDWTHRSPGEKQIDTTFFSPRLHARYFYTPDFSSRISYGRGYRAPLAFLESEHGLNEEGFEVNITQLEKSHSLMHTLAWEKNGWEAVLSQSLTHIKNLAFADFVIASGEPANFTNDTLNHTIQYHELTLGKHFGHILYTSLSLEQFVYPDKYKQRLPVAAQERRITLFTDLHLGNWEWTTSSSWIASRDISRYKGYDEHYQEWFTDPFDFLDKTTNAKAKKAPSYFMINTFLSRKLQENFQLYFAIDNILDVTQTGRGDSPTTWASHGNPLHFHLDNNHLWGPNRGRIWRLGMTATF